MLNQDLIKSGQITGYVLQRLKKMLVPGISGKNLNKKAQELIKELGGKPAFKNYQNYPASICFSVNSDLVHGLPTDRVIKSGDVVSIDLGVDYKGWITDAAITVGVELSDKALIKFISNTQLALYNAINVSLPGNTIYDVAKEVENVARTNHYSVASNLSGHGIGRSLHEKPNIPNFTSDNLKNIQIKTGMALAIEPMFGSKRLGNKLLISPKVSSDHWTFSLPDGIIGCHFEHSIYISQKEPIILTKLVDSI